MHKMRSRVLDLHLGEGRVVNDAILLKEAQHGSRLRVRVDGGGERALAVEHAAQPSGAHQLAHAVVEEALIEVVVFDLRKGRRRTA